MSNNPPAWGGQGRPLVLGSQQGSQQQSFQPRQQQQSRARLFQPPQHQGQRGTGRGVPAYQTEPSRAPAPTKEISLFPLKPKRTAPAPGKRVKLAANLFMMSLDNAKPIFQYGITVDPVEEHQLDETILGADTKEKPKGKEPRRLNQDLRRDAVDKAVKEWIKREHPSDYSKKLAFNYVFDINASVMYALFNMFSQPECEKSKEFTVQLKLPSIAEGKLDSKKKTFTIRIHRVGTDSRLNLKSLVDYHRGIGTTDITAVQEVTRAINVILRAKIVTVPYNIVTPFNVFPYAPKNQFAVSPGILINRGYSLSTRPAEKGVLLNVANTLAAFYEEIDLIDLLQQRFSVHDLKEPLRPDVIVKLKKEVLHKQVEARHLNYGSKERPHYRKYRVTDVYGCSLDKFTLVDKESKKTSEITIEDYFQREYKVKLKYPQLPCIVDKGRKLPIELCHLIEKQKVSRRMTPEETYEIIKKAAVPPQQHFAAIKEHVEEAKKHSQPLEDFGLTFDTKFVEVEGRELAPIALLGYSRRDIVSFNGEYRTQDKFYKPASVKRWVLAFLMDATCERDKKVGGYLDDAKIGQFASAYADGGRAQGISISGVHAVNFVGNDRMLNNEPIMKSELRRYFVHLNQIKVDHCIIVLPNRVPDWVYRYIQYLEVSAQQSRTLGEKWTRTSCLKYQNYTSKIMGPNENNRRSLISNLWLKHNTKLGGINFVLSNGGHMFLKEGYLFVSVDVCHPAPGDKLIQSVAAVVGMWDLVNEKMSYCTRLKVQRKNNERQSTIEHVGDIDIMVGDVLESYRRKKSKYPANIVILRDGVSEGQYRIVLDYEIMRMKSILVQKYGNSKTTLPRLACLVVQKRHKVKFRRLEPLTSYKGDKDYNIQPGTVVDCDITHPTDFSFYLAPHKALQGTSRAPHIYVICDEIGFTQEGAQEMMHALSYLSPRCTKSTSIPTPVNLADLAAERGKNIVISWNDDNQQKMKEEGRLESLNNFLSNMGEAGYENTLYYV